MQAVEHRKFAGIDDTADGIDDAAGQKPDKGTRWHQDKQIWEGKHT